MHWNGAVGEHADYLFAGTLRERLIGRKWIHKGGSSLRKRNCAERGPRSHAQRDWPIEHARASQQAHSIRPTVGFVRKGRA